MSDPDILHTFSFSEWLRAIGDSEAGMSVPCGECRGCCTSSYFIPVGPAETETLAAIPKRLLFRAPGLPKGNVLIGYAENGHCALFKDNACSIYADRPRACRAFDCRVFAATGLSEEGKPAIARQAERWRFAFPSAEDERLFEAVREAARFLHGHAGEFPSGFLPANATQQAGLALRVHGLFLRDKRAATVTVAEIVKAAGERNPASAGRPARKSAKDPRKPPGSRPRSGNRRPPGSG